jgi:hypothetical protein
MTPLKENPFLGMVRCPVCARLTAAEVDLRGFWPEASQGQKCPLCGASLDVAAVVMIPEAA